MRAITQLTTANVEPFTWSGFLIGMAISVFIGLLAWWLEHHIDN